jgi:hypothetical protein
MLSSTSALLAIALIWPPIASNVSTGQPVPNPSSLLTNIRDIGQVGRLLDPEHSIAARLVDHLPNRRKPDIDGRGRKALHLRPPLHE